MQRTSRWRNNPGLPIARKAVPCGAAFLSLLEGVAMPSQLSAGEHREREGAIMVSFTVQLFWGTDLAEMNKKKSKLQVDGGGDLCYHRSCFLDLAT